MFFQDHAIQYCNANLIHEYINHYLICNIYIFSTCYFTETTYFIKFKQCQ